MVVSFRPKSFAGHSGVVVAVAYLAVVLAMAYSAVALGEACLVVEQAAEGSLLACFFVP